MDDATRCAEQAREAGVAVTLEIWDEMFHVFQMARLLPETKKAVAHVAEFVSQNLKRAELIGMSAGPQTPVKKAGR